MAQLVDDNPGTHIFCDEVPVGGVAGISVKFLVELSKRIDRKLFIWLACNHDCKPAILTNALKEGLWKLFLPWLKPIQDCP